MQLNILSGGAANAIVTALANDFKAKTGLEIVGQYGAVGAMRDKLLKGAPADILILTRALIDLLQSAGHVVSGTAKDIGTVRTAVAVRTGDQTPDVTSEDELRAALLASTAIYFPDPKLATAGIHFANTLEKLGISEAVGPLIKTAPNGHTAMAELAADDTDRPIGCTQITEILAVDGVQSAGFLPPAFELATAYTAAVAAKAERGEEASKFIELMTSDTALQERVRCGFE